MRALIIGGSGFVGRRLAALLGSERGLPTFRKHPLDGGVLFDAEHDDLLRALGDDRAGLTHAFVLFGAIDMDGCARDPAATARVNVDSACRVLDAIISLGIFPIYASTDYVFDGSRGFWREEDEPHPVMEYGRQKLAVERYLSSRDAPSLIVRLSKVVSGDLATHSLLGEWMNAIRAQQVIRCAHDQAFSPAHVDDIAQCLITLAERKVRGLVHVAGPRRYSRLALLHTLIDAIRAVDPTVGPEIEPVSLHALPFAEKRPLDTSLATARLQGLINHQFRSMEAICAELASGRDGTAL